MKRGGEERRKRDRPTEGLTQREILDQFRTFWQKKKGGKKKRENGNTAQASDMDQIMRMHKR